MANVSVAIDSRSKSNDFTDRPLSLAEDLRDIALQLADRLPGCEKFAADCEMGRFLNRSRIKTSVEKNEKAR